MLRNKMFVNHFYMRLLYFDDSVKKMLTHYDEVNQEIMLDLIHFLEIGKPDLIWTRKVERSTIISSTGFDLVRLGKNRSFILVEINIFQT